MTTDSLTLATQAGAHATLSPAVLRLFGQATPAAETVEAASATARAYHYDPETASLFEAVSEVVYPSDGGTALKPQVREGWRTYNFEVEDLHTYIAGGLRVHNTSLPDLVPMGATEVVFADTDGDGKWDKADYKLGGGVSETIHGRDTDGNGTTDLVRRIKTVPREELLGPQDKVVWEETYQGTSTVPSEKKIVGIEYAPGTLQGEEAGRTLGSVLGHAIGGSNIFAQVASATITSTLLQNVGELLHKGVDLSLLSLDGHNVSPLEAAVTDTFKDFGKDLIGNAKVQALSALSGVLVGEIADALNLQGFERGLFSTVGNTVTNQVLTNVAMMTGVMEIPNTVVKENLNLLYGFDAVNMAANVANSLGGFFGSQLGQTAVRPKNEQASLFGSAASAVGAYIGTLTGLPIIGPMIGSFIGQTIGAALGNGLFDRDDAATIQLYTRDTGYVDTGSYWINNGTEGKFIELAASIANHIKLDVNGRNSDNDLRIDPNRSFNPFSVGVYIDTYNNRKIVGPDVDLPSSPENITGVIAKAVDNIFSNSEVIGGDLFARRAYTASHKEGLTRLSFDLQVAKDFKKYLANTSLINSMIADAPESAFSAGWIATLQRAQELGLNRLVDFNAMEYLASHGDLQQAFGRDKAAAERHMIESGIPEGRQVSFDALEYLAANPGLAQALGGIDRDRAVNHYLDYGRNEGRPTRFDATQYVAAHGDLANWLGANNPEQALRHYIEYGYREGRATTFDYRQYLAANPGLKEELGGVDATKASRHYIETGMREGLPTQFNNYAYLASHPDIWQAFGRNFGAVHQHVLDYGLRPTSFDASAYLNAHPDLQAAYGTSLEAAAEHFIVHGRNETWRSATWIGGPDERYVMGGAGHDTVTYAYTSVGLVVDLNAQRTWNGRTGDTLVSVENAIGSYFDDTLITGNGTTQLDGGDGNDTLCIVNSNQANIRGGNGVDTVSYLYASVGMFINLQAQGTWSTQTGQLNNSLSSIENAIGSRFDDTILTADSTTLLDGGDGSDTLFVVNSNQASIRGGNGVDTLSYLYSSVGMFVNLQAQGAWNTQNGQLSNNLSSIENAIGSRFDDTILTADSTTLLDGGDGNDTLFVVNSNQASIRGGNGVDTVSYEYASSGYTIDLDAGMTNRTGVGGGEFLDSIENAVGSSFNDQIRGSAGDNFIDGRAGDDVIFSHMGNDRVDGGSGNDFIAGWYGNDTLYGSDGNDQIHGEEDDDFIDAGTGNDTVYGGSGNDTIFSHMDSDWVDGGSGNDFIAGWYGNDTLFGSDGNDQIHGEEDHDFIGAGTGNDTVYGGSGYDDLHGEDGDDFLMGNSQDDWLSGGRGRDTFGFGTGDGRDVIRDFTSGGWEADVIAFNSGVMTSFAAVQAASRQDGADVLIAVTPDSSIRLQNVALHTLSAANFTFS